MTTSDVQDLTQNLFLGGQGRMLTAEVAALATAVVVASEDGTGFPDLDTRDGGVFDDAGGGAVKWFLPAWELDPDPDESFAFRANREGSDQNGHPFHRVTLELGLHRLVPAQVAAARAAQPADGTGSSFQLIPCRDLATTLTLTGTGSDGTAFSRPFTGQVTLAEEGEDGWGAAVFSALVGSDVVLLFAELVSTGQASLAVSSTFEGVRWQTKQTQKDHIKKLLDERFIDPGWRRFVREKHDITDREVATSVLTDVTTASVGELTTVKETVKETPGVDFSTAVTRPLDLDLSALQLPAFQIHGLVGARGLTGLRGADVATAAATESTAESTTELFQPEFLQAEAEPVMAGMDQRLQRLSDQATLIDLSEVVAVGGADTDPKVAVRSTATDPVELPISLKYAGPSYRPRYTLTDGTETHGIVNAADLEEFDHEQSEFIELTVLGNVAARYPSLRAVYLGQVSGTVIAVPARYGIRRAQTGLAASCQALVDSSPQSASGCRFTLTFGLGPVVDPGDLARLAADLKGEPTLQGRVLSLTLPTTLDTAAGSALQSSYFSNVRFSMGDQPTAFVVVAEIADAEGLPAVAAANLVLTQLMDRVTPSLVGALAVRLDDAHTPAVFSDVVLNVSATAGGQDVVMVRTADGSSQLRLSNQTVMPLEVSHLTGSSATGLTTLPAGQVLAPLGSCVVSVPAGVDQLLADCVLDLPDGPLKATDYLTFTTQDVQRVHHPIAFNAAGRLAGLVSVTVETSLVRAPDVPVPTIVLSPDHEIDNTGVVEVPVLFAFDGLEATVSLTVVRADGGSYQRSLTHDFLARPLLVLSPEDLAEG